MTSVLMTSRRRVILILHDAMMLRGTITTSHIITSLDYKTSSNKITSLDTVRTSYIHEALARCPSVASLLCQQKKIWGCRKHKNKARKCRSLKWPLLCCVLRIYFSNAKKKTDDCYNMSSNSGLSLFKLVCSDFSCLICRAQFFLEHGVWNFASCVWQARWS